jgi:hypothetical protein
MVLQRLELRWRERPKLGERIVAATGNHGREKRDISVAPSIHLELIGN